VPGHSTRQPDHTMSRPADAHLRHIGSLGTLRSRLARSQVHEILTYPMSSWCNAKK